MVKKVSIIIPNYNGAKLLQDNLPKVIAAAQKYSADTEVIVVDDLSTDGSVSFLQNNFPEVKVIVKKKNEGFSSSCNLGVLNSQGEIVVLLNTDIYPENNFLQPLIEHFNNESVFAVGCLEKSKEENKIILRGRGIGYFHNGFLVHERGEVDKNNTLWASGGSAAFSKIKWTELGGFDEIYNPFYWEDIDLSYRAQKRGWVVLFEKKSVVHHEHAKGPIKTIYKPAHIEAIAFRNQLIFMWKNITDAEIISHHIFLLPTNLLKFLVNKKESFLRGFILAVGKLPQMLIKKRQNKFLLSDREIVGKFLVEIKTN